LRVAMRAALDKKGVAVLVIPGNILQAEVKGEPEVVFHSPTRSIPAQEALDKAAEILNHSKKVSILAGAGCEGAHDEL
ncbi:hypothetical protein QP168_10865, partial [Aerococcus urinae]|nr:hypothetical protein [Aerococcus urinae]